MAGVRVLPEPAFLVLNVWLRVAASPVARLPEVIVGVPVELVVPSYVLVSVTAVIVIAMLLSGFLYPVETMPRWAQLLGSVFPLTHYVRAARLALLQSGSPTAILTTAPPIAGFLFLAIALAVLGRTITVDD